MKIALSVALAVAAGALSFPAAAQFQKPEDAMKYRKAAFTVMAAHFGRLGAMAQGKAPFDAKIAAENAAMVKTMAAMPWSAFVPESDMGETKAKPEIWTERAKFDKAAQDLQAAADKLNASTGNLDQLKAAFGETAKTCKACHDAYREK